MILCDQVINLQSAKKLKELWFEKDSLYLISEIWNIEDNHCAKHERDDWKTYPAYTCAELM